MRAHLFDPFVSAKHGGHGLGLALGLAIVLGAPGCGSDPGGQAAATLTDEQVENIVRRSYQYVAMYNVNNKFAMKQGGWNTVEADTQLKDHTMRDIARPNNDTLYISALLDLRKDPVILEMPAFDSDYVSLMVTGYDHHVNIPMATRLGDFGKPEKILFYTERTEGYDGEPVEGVDRVFEASGDFISAVLRIMPHANDEERFKRIVEQMEQVRIETLSEFRGEPAKPIDDIEFPAVGQRDADIFGDNLLEVMQFVFNHTTFHADNGLDQALLAAYEPLGVVPGEGDGLLFGPESRGLPPDVIEAAYGRIRLPMRAGSRSLNLSNTVAIVAYEALRQNGFDGMK